jgi:asparaginyl-tRNA synthetase
MFKVTTLDIANPPRKDDGSVDYSQDFFGKPANLTVSGQLNAENFAMAFGDVYTFGPTFRAENSNTQRHAAEFWMIEPEMAFTDLKGDMDVAEAMIKFIINTRAWSAAPTRWPSSTSSWTRACSSGWSMWPPPISAA